jgi:RNA polymerase sigma-70 factor (ECF subfamily)
MKAQSDSELVSAVKLGDSRAFDTLFMRWYPQVRRFIVSLIKDQALAEDLAQTVFLKVWNNRAVLSPEQSLRNYLFILSRNAVLDVLRSKNYKLRKDVAEAPVEVVSSYESFHQAEFRETYSRVLRIIAEMPPQRQSVFKMSRFQSKSAQEIADTMGLSVRTVEKHLELALKDIRRQLN